MLNEIKEDDLEGIELNRNLHFDNIFGNKLRIAFPLDQNSKIKELINELEELGYKVDYQDLLSKKIAYKKIETKQGEKLRPEKVGKILQSNNLPKLLDWWQKNSDKLKNSDVGASVIISRSPIDLVRMSDHDGISSCHSPSHSHFKCAKQEARTGGAVAYVVKNSDLKNINLQDDEIFQDDERNVNGIVPLERTRLRRVSNGSISVLLPEKTTYGIKNIGFLDSVKDWAKNSQKDILQNIDSIEDYNSFEIRGGSYEDTNSRRLWSDFFDTEITKGDLSNPDEDEEDRNEGNSIDLADRQLEEHQSNWKHFHVSLDESDNSFYYSGYSGFIIPKKMFIVDFDKNYDDIKETIEEIINYEIDGIEYLEIEESYRDKNNYQIQFSFNDSNDYYYTNNLNDRFEHFLDHVDELDEKYDEILNKILAKLRNANFIENPIQKIKFNNLNIEIDEDTGFVEIDTKMPEKVYYIKDINVFRGDIKVLKGDVFLKKSLGKDFFEEIPKIINKNKAFPFFVEQNEMRFFLKEAGTTGWLPSRRANYDDEWAKRDQFDSNLPENYTKLSGWLYITLNVELSINHNKYQDTINKLNHLDKNWNFYLSKINKLIDLWMKTRKDPIERMNVRIPKPIKPTFKKNPKQLGLNFKEWLESGTFSSSVATFAMPIGTGTIVRRNFPEIINKRKKKKKN